MVVAHKPRHWSREEYEQMVETDIVGPGDGVRPAAAPGAEIPVDDLLP